MGTGGASAFSLCDEEVIEVTVEFRVDAWRAGRARFDFGEVERLFESVE